MFTVFNKFKEMVLDGKRERGGEGEREFVFKTLYRKTRLAELTFCKRVLTTLPFKTGLVVQKYKNLGKVTYLAHPVAP